MAHPTHTLLLAGLLLPVLAAAPAEVLLRGGVAPRPNLRHSVAPPATQTTPLTGRLFYEDHRRAGRPDRRQDLQGRPGARKPSRIDPDNRFLGAWYMEVDVFEKDARTDLADGCAPLEKVGSATVGPDGHFSVDVPAADRCDGDAVRYLIRARTRHCVGPLCFQVGRVKDAAHTLWFATRTPLVPTDGTLSVGDLLFDSRSASGPSTQARAANHFASLVDAVVALHVDTDIPFRLEEYGPLTVRFPSPFSSGRATAADLIDANNIGWPLGKLLIHEYGHIIQRRAWGGDYAGFEDPIQQWSGARSPSAEIPFIAMKEGWAVFVERYVSGRCFRRKYDTNDNLTSLRRDVPGRHFPDNHHRMFCDWVDDTDDRRAGVLGEGDVVSVDLRTLWEILDRTDDTTSLYAAHDPVTEGLDICDVAQSYLTTQADDPAEHDRHTWQIASLLENNDLACDSIPAPASLRAHDLRVTVRPVEGSPPVLPTQASTVEIANAHPYMPSPPTPLEIIQDGTLLRMRLTVPPLKAGGIARYTVATTRSTAPRSLEAALLDQTGRDTDHSNDRAAWIVPANPPDR